MLLLVVHTVKKHLEDFRLFQNSRIPAQLLLAAGGGMAAGYFFRECLLKINYVVSVIINSIWIVLVFFGLLLLVKCPLILGWKQKVCKIVRNKKV